MNSKLNEYYDKNFYETHMEGMSESALAILSLLFEYYKPQSVIDIGCGQGAWLAVAESLGVKILKGVDGDWVRKDALLSKSIDFVEANLNEKKPKIIEKFDLCISSEVAEHISEKNAKQFVDLLCSASDTVLFSAAIRHQGGTNHVNEQWQSYWIELFSSNGYIPIDCIRGNLWDNISVEWWYRQNIFLFTGPDNKSINLKALRALEKPISDIVHPINYEKKIINYEKKISKNKKNIESYKTLIEHPSLWFCMGCIKRYITNKFKSITS
jgi:SAM-dependent methyltransferase